MFQSIVFIVAAITRPSTTLVSRFVRVESRLNQHTVHISDAHRVGTIRQAHKHREHHGARRVALIQRVGDETHAPDAAVPVRLFVVRAAKNPLNFRDRAGFEFPIAIPLEQRVPAEEQAAPIAAQPGSLGILVQFEHCELRHANPIGFDFHVRTYREQTQISTDKDVYIPNMVSRYLRN
jgi:hypothetical protein